MATYTDNYSLTKPTFAEVADIRTINGNMDTIDDIMHASQVSLADAYDQTATYNTGDVVMYEFLMYKCKEDNVTGNWDATKWERTTAAETGGGGSVDFDLFGEASGNPASFADGSESALVECEVEFEPKQDLHGYDKPWAGGTGKNKLPLVLSDIKALNTTGIWSGNTYTINSVTFKVVTDNAENVLSIELNGTASARTDFYIADFNAYGGNYTISGSPANGQSKWNLRIDLAGGGANQCLDDGRGYQSSCTMNTASGTAVECIFRIYQNSSVSGLTLYPMLESGTSVTTYEPYSNICPISGYTAVKVDVAGKNLLDNTLCIERTNNGIQRIVNNDGTITITGTSTFASQWWNSVDNLGVFFKKGTYTISCNEVELRALFRKAQIVSGTFTLSEDDYLDNVFFITTVGETYNLRTEPMIRLATESDTFEPYKGSTTTTPLGQTVYGGQLNVLTGELTVDRAIVDLGSFTWISESTTISGLARIGVEEVQPLGAIYNQTPICSSYEGVTPKGYAAFNNGEIGFSNNEANPMIRVRDQNFASMTDAQIKSAMNGVTLCYELATPITVQLTPTEIATLLGQNYISADTGDIDVVYTKSTAFIKPNPSGEADGVLSSIELSGEKFEIIKELPTFPTSDGDYKLKLSVSSGVPTLSWVSDT